MSERLHFHFRNETTKWIIHFISKTVLNIRDRGTNKADKSFSLERNYIPVRKRIDNVD